MLFVASCEKVYTTGNNTPTTTTTTKDIHATTTKTSTTSCSSNQLIRAPMFQTYRKRSREKLKSSLNCEENYKIIIIKEKCLVCRNFIIHHDDDDNCIDQESKCTCTITKQQKTTTCTNENNENKNKKSKSNLNENNCSHNHYHQNNYCSNRRKDLVNEKNPSKRYNKMSNLIHMIKNLRKSQLVLTLLLLINSMQLVNGGKTNDIVLVNGLQQTTLGLGVCGSLDIRNSPDELQKLEGCRVIEGFLQILLIENRNSTAINNYSFPLLVEVTEFVLFYRVAQLKTFRKLFPNLAVIRGDKLFNDMALVIYEMFSLEEIGLLSLTEITLGAVHIEKNSNLCFADTIDWVKIAHNTTKHDHTISGNKNPNECPVCKRQTSTGKLCPELKTELGKDKYLCWNVDDCQNVCPSNCPGSCMDNQTCCSQHCLGGCNKSDYGECTACRSLVEHRNGKQICHDSCQRGLYQLNDRRCLNKTECSNRQRPITAHPADIPYPYIPFHDADSSLGTCIMDCPLGYYAETECEAPEASFKSDPREKCRKRCKQCNGPCEKYCIGGVIDNISAAKAFKDCTVIEGPLEISIRKGGHNVVKELEDSLYSVKRITKNLKIVRSYPLVSLSFFKNLQRIDGEGLDVMKENALTVMDNQNLQDLFNTDKFNLTIVRGRIAFHYNSKLCMYKIETFKATLGPNIVYDSYDATKNSNGDKIACSITKLDVNMTVSDKFAILRWKRPELGGDGRALLGFVVYYTEAASQNVTLYDGRDACGGDGWEIDDLAPDGPIASHALTNLKAYTQYAFYVKTLLLSSERQGAQSDILYFKTLPGQPDPVNKLVLLSNSSSEISVKWSPPKSFNGEPDMYEITVNLTEDRSIIYKRDYCIQSLSDSDTLKSPSHSSKEKYLKDQFSEKGQCESCSQERCSQVLGLTKNRIIDEEHLLHKITFEDKIHDWVYVKQDDGKKHRRKREITGNVTIPVVESGYDINGVRMVAPLNNVDELFDEKGNIKFKVYTTNATELKVTGLKHFSTYSVAVKACRKFENVSTIEPKPLCSVTAIEHYRTLKVAHADMITRFTAMQEQSNTSYGAIRIEWDPPKDPNGVIVSYSIKYTRGDSLLNVKPLCITAQHFEGLKRHYVLEVAEPGNYSIQVMATSIAGDGNYTSSQIVIIPEKGKPIVQIILIVVAIIVLCVITGLGVTFYIKQKYPPPVANMKLIASVNTEYMSMQYTPDEWEVPREKIIRMQELGQGSFGMVYAGVIKDLHKQGEEIRCAIKTVNENATDRERINFLKEASVMKAFDTTHVVKLLGVVSSGQPTLVVMELMANGDLKEYLRARRPDNIAETIKKRETDPTFQGTKVTVPTLREHLRMAIEIADGMAYLAHKKFVHRDLAARNCMVSENLTVKIGDFGMARDIYETDYYRKGTRGLLPVRWMSPESLRDGKFTSASDVFSFGVVLYEMASLAQQPYQGLSNDQVLHYVMEGGVMEKPENCDETLYHIMQRCWISRPTARPTFMDLVGELLPYASPNFRETSFYFHEFGQRYLLELQNARSDEFAFQDDDEAANFTDGDYFLAAHAANSQLLQGNEMPVVRSSQPLSSGIASGILSYPINEEEDDDVADQTDNDEPSIRRRITAIPGPSHIIDPSSRNGSAIGAHTQQGVPTSGNNNNNSSSNNSSSNGSTAKPATIVPATTTTTTNETDVGLERSQNLQRARGNFLNAFFPTTLQKNHHRRPKDVENPLDNDDDDDEEDDDLLDSGTTSIRLTKTPKKPTDKKTTDEELRPLSNGFVLQQNS